MKQYSKAAETAAKEMVLQQEEAINVAERRAQLAELTRKDLGDTATEQLEKLKDRNLEYTDPTDGSKRDVFDINADRQIDEAEAYLQDQGEVRDQLDVGGMAMDAQAERQQEQLNNEIQAEVDRIQQEIEDRNKEREKLDAAYEKRTQEERQAFEQEVEEEFEDWYTDEDREQDEEAAAEKTHTEEEQRQYEEALKKLEEMREQERKEREERAAGQANPNHDAGRQRRPPGKK